MRYRHFARFAAAVAALAFTATAGAQTELRNDAWETDQAAGFQGGFAAGEQFAVRFIPQGDGPWRLLRVDLLYGGAATTEDVTLRIFDDAAQMPEPGQELFSGNFSLTGSDEQLNSIDLSSMNVMVSDTFRVAFMTTHMGFPSIARDDDPGSGNDQADLNWIEAEGIGWVMSSTLGVLGDWVLRATVMDMGGQSTGGAGGSGAAGGIGGSAGSGGAGGDPCMLNSDCPLGEYCGDDDRCTLDCRLASDCMPGESCNALGQCVSSGGGGGCSTGGQGPRAAALLLLLGALVAARGRRRA